MMDIETYLMLRDLLAAAFFATVGAGLTAYGLLWWGNRKKNARKNT